MIREALRHTGTYPDIYLTDRSTMVIRFRTAAKDHARVVLHHYYRIANEPVQDVDMIVKYEDRLFTYHVAEVRVNGPACYHKYFFEVQGDETLYYGAWDITETYPEEGYFEFLYANETNVVKVPDWSRGAVFYQIFPERYCNGDPSISPANVQPWGTKPEVDNYMGGDLRGIITKLPYIADLGVDCIYLNPIFLANANHKYATIDYMEIDPQFGTKEDFRELVDKAHAYGIRVVLDGVFNHCSPENAFFADLLKNQEASPYYRWFYPVQKPVTFTTGAYECFASFKGMPKFNTGNPEVREYVFKVMDYWITEFHTDGWRLDVADEMDEGLWNDIRYRLKLRHPDAILLGETWGPGLRLMDGTKMDSMMNYVFRDGALEFVARGHIDAKTFNNRMQKMQADYPECVDQGMFLVLDSHDTERFLTSCGGSKEKMKMAAALQMTFVGAPSLYYGDEIGIDGNNDPDCRKCMVWEEENQDLDLKAHYKKLIALRRNSCIRTGSFTCNVCDGKVYGYIRKDADGEVVVLMNAGAEARTVTVPVCSNGVYSEYLGGGSLTITASDPVPADARPTDGVTYAGSFSVEIPAYGTMIFTKID